MKASKAFALILAASAAGLIGWGGVHWSQERAREAAFEQRQIALLADEYARLKSEVVKIDPEHIAPSLPDAPSKADLEKATSQLRERMELYSEEKHALSEEQWRKKIERDTARIRGLEFKEPVSYNVLNRSEIGKVLEGKFAEQFTDEEFDAMVAGYVAIGLLPEGFPLKQVYIDLLSEQIAAFYDQHTHKLFMFSGASLSNAQNRVILSHELTHALQDQHFSIKNLPLELRTNDDRAIAASALVEGDATVEMQLYMVEKLDSKAAMQAVLASFSQNMEKIASAPRLLRESLLFPYMEGAKFCAALQEASEEGGFQPIDQAFRRVPASTTQILHPEKYLAGEEPIPVEWPSLEWQGEKPSFDNVLGEFGVRILLSEWGQSEFARRAAEGWRGDRYLVYRGGKAVVWRTLWEDASEATEFATVAARMLTQRFGAELDKRDESTRQLEHEGRAAMLVQELEGSEVLIIQAPTAAECDTLLAQFGKTATPQSRH